VDEALRRALDSPLPKWLDNSVITDYRVCWRRGFWRHRCGVRTDDRQLALEFGAAIHEALHAYYREGRSVDAALLAFDEKWKGDAPEDAKRTREKGHLILKAYRKHYAEERFKIHALETTGATTLPGVPVPYCFKLDMLIEDEVGVWVVDHKTTSSFSPTLFKGTRPNPQFTGYVECASRVFGTPVSGVIVNWILVARGKEKFLREAVDYDEWEREAWRRETATFWKELERRWERGALGKVLDAFPRNTTLCTTYFGECPYRRLCNTEPSWKYLVDELTVGYELDPWTPVEGLFEERERDGGDSPM